LLDLACGLFDALGVSLKHGLDDAGGVVERGSPG
jgi:hypothetical protein